MRLGLREANQRFSAAMRAVRSGEEVVITDRGRAFAVILPYQEGDGLRHLIDAGVLHPPTVARSPRSFRPIKLRSGTLSEFLNEDRGE